MNFLAPLGTGLFYLGLSLVIGGLITLGAFAAPVLFKSFARPEAGEAMTIIFRRYDTVLLVSMGLLVVGELLRILPNGLPPMNFLVVSRYVVLAVLVVMTVYTSVSLDKRIAEIPRMEEFRTNVELREEFNTLHKRSEKLAKMELLAAVLLIFLTPFVPSNKLI